MKILHVIPSVSPVRGGPSQAVLEMVKTLIAEDIEASIITTNDNGCSQLDVPINKWITYQGVPVRFFSRFSPNINSIREFAFSRTLTTWLRENIKNYDLVHVHAIFSYPATVAMAIARQQGIPYIVRPLGQLCEWSLKQSKLKKKLYLKLIERANIEGSQGLHLTSRQEQAEVKKLQLACSTFVVPHGLTFATPITHARQRLRAKFGLAEDETVILFLSRIHPKKGLDYLISALGKLKNYSFTFILAGSGDPVYEADVRSLLKASQLDTRTILPGFVKGEAKELLLQGADLYALTSHSENFGVAVLEALAAGLPVVVTSGVALSEEISRHQLGYVSDLSEDKIFHALETCLKAPAAAVETGQRAQKFTLKNYSWKRNADNLIAIYTTLLKSPSKAQLAEPNHTAYSYLQ